MPRVFLHFLDTVYSCYGCHLIQWLPPYFLSSFFNCVPPGGLWSSSSSFSFWCLCHCKFVGPVLVHSTIMYMSDHLKIFASSPICSCWSRFSTDTVLPLDHAGILSSSALPSSPFICFPCFTPIQQDWGYQCFVQLQVCSSRDVSSLMQKMHP